MGLLRMVTKAGIAKKVFDEARKPHNQAKAKELFTKLNDRRTGRTTGNATPSDRTTRSPRPPKAPRRP